MHELSDEHYMGLALEAARRGVEAGQTPFGACIVGNGRVIACEHNRVWLNTDITAHAEVQAIRAACAAAGKIDLSGATIYSTTEPCPMCFSAIHWARIDRIVYGASIADAQTAGFHELAISNLTMKSLGASDVELVTGCCGDACRLLFDQWQQRGDARTY